MENLETQVKMTKPLVEQNTTPTTKVIKPTKNLKPIMVIAVVLVVLAGIGTGFIISEKGAVSGTQNISTSGTNLNSNTVGSTDETTFKDTAEGVLTEGGVNGEGTYHLVRPGGVSQNVYLTSTVIDLSSFVGKKVQVWGQTMSARKAGWLMDVGKIKGLE